MRIIRRMTTALAAIILLASCEKESNIPTTSEIETNLEQFRFEQNTVFSGLNNFEDKDDHHINVCLYNAAQAIKNTLVTDDNNVTSLFGRYESGENAIRVAELVKEESVDFTNQEHYRNFSEMEQSMIYRNINYYNVLSFMNVGDARTVLSNSKKFIVAIAVEINDEDALPGWIIENGTAKEITILEEDLNANTPIFIVQNSTDHIEYPNNPDPANLQWTGTPTNNSRTTGPITIDWDSYRIKSGYRYENTGRSELAYELTLYSPNSPYVDNSWVSFLFNTYSLGYLSGRTIKNVKKSEIDNSTLLTDNKWFVQGHPSDLYDINDAQYHVTVYEYDWGQSKKSVGNCEGALAHLIRMKYSHEWYYKDYCGFSGKDSFVGATFTVDNAKCTLQLTRTI